MSESKGIVLLPCPLCGGAAATKQPSEDSKFWLAFCVKCDCETGYLDSEPEAASAWNHRSGAAVATLTAQRDALRAACERGLEILRDRSPRDCIGWWQSCCEMEAALALCPKEESCPPK